MTDGAQQQSHAQCFTRFDKRLLTDLSSHFNETALLIKYGPPSIFSQKQFIYGNNSPLYSVFISFILCERLIILTVFLSFFIFESQENQANNFENVILLSKMTFESEVKRDINNRLGLFKSFRDPTYVTTANGQRCAVFVNQGLTCTDVILYYWESGKLVRGLKETRS